MHSSVYQILDYHSYKLNTVTFGIFGVYDMSYYDTYCLEQVHSFKPLRKRKMMSLLTLYAKRASISLLVYYTSIFVLVIFYCCRIYVIVAQYS